MTEVEVAVPDGVFPGMEFTLSYEGTELTVVCPDCVGPGDPINLTIDVPAAGGGGTPGTQAVNIVVPDGCFPGMEFTVDFEGTPYNIAVPDGTGPGQEITIELPASGGGAEAPAQMEVTDEMYEEAFKKASKGFTKPDPDLLRYALVLYCTNNGDIPAVFAAMGDDPSEALRKPQMTDTPEKFAANYALGYFKVRAGQSSVPPPAAPVLEMTDEMFQEAYKRASKMGTRPDPDILRWALSTYCAKNGDISAPKMPILRGLQLATTASPEDTCCVSAALSAQEQPPSHEACLTRAGALRLEAPEVSESAFSLRLTTGDIPAIFAAMGDDPAEALIKPTFCDTPDKFAANYVLGYFKVRVKR